MSESSVVADESHLLSRIVVDGGREVRDPATGEPIGKTVEHTVADLDAAIDAARRAQPAWEALGWTRRRELLTAAADRIEEHAEALARLLSREQGKPLNGPNARVEVGICAMWLRETAALDLPAELVVDEPGNHAEVVYRPVGVVGAISPWNWPLMIAVWQIAPSLLVGNTVVIKPSEHTPLGVQALVSVLNEVLPAGVLNVVAGGRDVGAALAAHPGVDKILFTGSTATGKAIIRASADNITRLSLELGGNDAGIVLPGTDVAAHAEDLFWGAFLNNGQTCVAIKRLYVHESQYDEVVDALAAHARATPMGHGLDETNVLGPLQNRQQFDIVSRLVEDAKTRGARIVTGGAPASELGELFYPVTIVADVADGIPLVDEEQFGPVLPVISYRDVEEAIAAANGLEAALGASVWSDDVDAAREVALRLQAGTVWINRHTSIDPRIPYGGAKQSGYGLEFGVEGLKAVALPVVIWR